MNMKRLVSIITVGIAILFFASVVVFAVTTTLVVFPGNLQGWQTQVSPGLQPTPASTPSVTFVFGPATPPLGRGSAQLSVGSDGGAAAQLRHPGYAGTVLPTPIPSPTPTPSPTPPGELAPAFPASNELTALAYSTYVQSGGSGSQAPYIILNVDYDNNGTEDDQLVFEPQYQNSTDCPSFNQGNVTNGTWQTWNALNGCWYSKGGVAGSGPGTNVEPLRTITAAQPNARIVNSGDGGGGVRIVAGFGAGAWDNFVGNVDNFQIGVGEDPDTGTNITAYDFEPKAPPALASNGVIISELRNSGPGLPVCAAPTAVGIVCVAPGLPVSSGGDEYVELYNTTDNDIAVTSVDGSGGWSLVRRGSSCADPPVVVATIPDGTIIPARGHYLLAGAGYSLRGYPAGDGSSQTPQMKATPDQTYSDTIGGDANVGLFNTTSSFDLPHRLDAVGFNNGSGDTCDLLSEGTPLPPTRGSTSQYAFVRKEPLSGGVQDTNNNAADFVEVSTTPLIPVGDNASPVLGAPGPQNTSSPVNRDDVINIGLTAPSLAQSLSPNRERRLVPDTCSPLGTLLIRRSVTNNTGGPVSRLRFRVIDVTTVNSPNVGNGTQAVLHVRSSSNETLPVTGRGVVQLRGLNAEQPPNQDAAQCGGLNTSLSDDTITLSSPLAPGATIDVVFLLGVQQSGYFRFYVNVEALESSAPPSGSFSPSSPLPTRSKTPIAMPITVPGKPPGTTPVIKPFTPPFATPGVTPPATPAVTPGWKRKVTPDDWPDESSGESPAMKRTRRDNR